MTIRSGSRRSPMHAIFPERNTSKLAKWLRSGKPIAEHNASKLAKWLRSGKPRRPVNGFVSQRSADEASRPEYASHMPDCQRALRRRNTPTLIIEGGKR